jgi:hypothetical protein
MAGTQCTLKVAGDLVCGCEVFINPDNFDSARVDADLKVYQDMGCQQPSTCDCAGAIEGTCKALGDVDICETTFG